MPSFELIISGDRQTVARLTTIETAIDTTPPLDAIGAASLPIVREYPPELPNQRYVRTGRLGRGWQASAAGSVITLDNPVDYAGAVYGPNQRAAFAGRWPQRPQQVAAILPRVLEAYRTWVQAIVGRRG